MTFFFIKNCVLGYYVKKILFFRKSGAKIVIFSIQKHDFHRI